MFMWIVVVVYVLCEICKLIEIDVLYWIYVSKSICVFDFFVKREVCVYIELKVSVYLWLYCKDKYVSIRILWYRRLWCYDCCFSK